MRGKVFLLMTETRGEPVVIVKAHPEGARALRDQHEDIMPGHYLDKVHWISVGPGRGVTKRLVDDLVQGSYDLASDRRKPSA